MNNNFYNYPFDNENINMLNEMFINDVSSNNINTQKGYIKGNIYDDLYNQYKNYKPLELIPNNEQADMLLNINNYSFIAHDIRLYLDIYPDNKDMINKYNDYQMKANMLIKEYENKYGPIMVNSLSNNNMFSWEEYPWPWEMEEN